MGKKYYKVELPFVLWGNKKHKKKVTSDWNTLSMYSYFVLPNNLLCFNIPDKVFHESGTKKNQIAQY